MINLTNVNTLSDGVQQSYQYLDLLSVSFPQITETKKQLHFLKHTLKPLSVHLKSKLDLYSMYLKMLHCRQLLCKIITTKTSLTSCSTKSLSIEDTIHLHFLSWLTDRGFHHVSLLVHEATQRNNLPLWKTHQSHTPCPTLTAELRDNRSFVLP